MCFFLVVSFVICVNCWFFSTAVTVDKELSFRCVEKHSENTANLQTIKGSHNATHLETQEGATAFMAASPCMGICDANRIGRWTEQPPVSPWGPCGPWSPQTPAGGRLLSALSTPATSVPPSTRLCQSQQESYILHLPQYQVAVNKRKNAGVFW